MTTLEQIILLILLAVLGKVVVELYRDTSYGIVCNAARRRRFRYAHEVCIIPFGKQVAAQCASNAEQSAETSEGRLVGDGLGVPPRVIS